MIKKKIHYVIPLKKRAQTVGTVLGGTAVAIILFILASSFVVDGEFIIRGGKITINNVKTGAQILLDSKYKGTVNDKQNSFNIKRVKRGSHTLIVTKDTYWPWVHNVDVLAGQTLHITPLLIPQEVTSKIVDTAPSSPPVPARLSPIVLKSTESKISDTAIWVDNNTIYTQRGIQQTPIAVFTAEYPVRSLALYPSRTDTLLVAAGSKIFALDIKASNTRNFLPIYTSAAPTFAIDEESGTIFIKDEEKILELQI